MTWAYAITDDAASLPHVPGLDGAPLATVAAAGVHAVVSRHDDDAPPQWSREALLRHEAVVEALMPTRAVLPLRFGTALPSDEEVAQALEENGEDWPALLDRVRGRVELAVTVPAGEPDGGDAAAPGDGRRYLLDKVEEHRAARAAARTLDDAIGALADGAHHRLQPTTGVAVKAAYLVLRSHVDEACRRMEAAVEGVICTGPWPPYSFTTADRLPVGEGGPA
jgi:hypothetical protein